MDYRTTETLVKIYAVLDWVFAAFLTLAGLVLLFGGSVARSMIANAIATEGQIAAAIGAGVVTMIGIVFLVLAIVYTAVGVAVWNKQSWGRVAQLVLSIISVFNFPIGTLIGGFGIYLFGFEDTTKEVFGHKPIVHHTTTHKPVARKHR